MHTMPYDEQRVKKSDFRFAEPVAAWHGGLGLMKRG